MARRNLVGSDRSMQMHSIPLRVPTAPVRSEPAHMHHVTTGAQSSPTYPLTNVVNFNTRLNDLDLIANDLRINRKFEVDGAALSFTGGFYASRQNVDTDWLWTSHVQTVEGNGNSVLIDIVDADD